MTTTEPAKGSPADGSAPPAGAAAPVSRVEIDEVFRRCDTRGRWGKNDQRGALNNRRP